MPLPPVCCVGEDVIPVGFQADGQAGAGPCLWDAGSWWLSTTPCPRLSLQPHNATGHGACLSVTLRCLMCHSHRPRPVKPRVPPMMTTMRHAPYSVLTVCQALGWALTQVICDFHSNLAGPAWSPLST